MGEMEIPSKCIPDQGYHVWAAEGDSCQCGERTKRMITQEVAAPTVMGCARCGQDHQVRFKPFKRPMVVGESELTHWGMCPVTREPILMRFVENEED
ncbi:MAG TPA: hypothetical protein VLA89_00025 [Gemmatimonadales bacterium]|nr:hypothetical protein [Gemmatimonadales bacterium]